MLMLVLVLVLVLELLLLLVLMLVLVLVLGSQALYASNLLLGSLFLGPKPRASLVFVRLVAGRIVETQPLAA